MTSLIIVNWNTCEYLARCLASIEENLADAESQVVVVDNASTDGSVAMVRQRFPRAVLIANTVNRGFSGGVNDGLQAAQGSHVLILNPDIILRTGVVESLTRYLDDHPDVAAVAPSLRNPDGSEQARYFRRLPSLIQVVLFLTFLTSWSLTKRALVERYLETSRKNGNDPTEVEQIPGAFLMTSRRVLDLVGAFDEHYRLFFEDVDWSFRAREKGLKLVQLPSLEVTHIGGRSFVVDDGTWIQPRYLTSLITYFTRRKRRVTAMAAALILSLNCLLFLAKNSLWRGGNRPDARKQAAVRRRAQWNTLRLFFIAFVLQQDKAPLV